MGWLKPPPRFDEDVFPIEKWGYFQPVMSIFSMEKPPTSKWRDGMTLHHLPSFFGFPPKKVKLKVHGSHVRGAHGFFLEGVFTKGSVVSDVYLKEKHKESL